MSNCRDSRCGCVDRRQFLKLTAAATVSAALTSPMGAMAGPFEPKDTADHFVPADKKLRAEWLAALTAKGEPAWYSGKDLEQIGMPVGGICTGQLYLAGDGRLVHWDIFNEVPEDGRPRTNYEMLPAPIARVQQGFAVRALMGGQWYERTLDKEGFPAVRFRGEYPIGKVEYRDEQFPLAISLEAFSPFIPLNSADSGLPATILEFTIRNQGKRTAEVKLGGCLQNAVCCLTDVGFEGRRQNRFSERQGLAMLACSAAAVVATNGPKPRPAVVVADFEQENYGGWKIEGKAFGHKPARGTLPNQQPVTGFLGKGLVNSFVEGDESEGKITSPPFKIERWFINFLIGGGARKNKPGIFLLMDGKPVRTATGLNDEKLLWRSWDVRNLEGKEAQIEIVDQHSGPWGHVNVDHIEMSDEPQKMFEGPLEKQADYGTMCLALPGRDLAADGEAELSGSLAKWLRGEPGSDSAETATKPFGNALTGALAAKFKLRPGQQRTIPFIISWHFANLPTHGNHYATRHKDAMAVAEYVAENFKRLSTQTKLWRDTWYDSTLPVWLLDKLFAPVSILASATCQRWANGRFWAWEGVRCCAGTCAHVWNYAHALARLFPDLERTVREMQDFDKGFVEATGAINFRGESNDFWAGDSQGGTAMKCLREHQMSTDSGFLKRNWPRIRKSVEFLMTQDGNGDGLIEGSQHNTYDINFFGANTMVGSLYLGALRAAEELAKEIGDADFAAKCRDIFERGSHLTVEQLFNGEYFIQKVDLEKHPKHQYGEGCLADQLFGQGWAHQVGLGYLYPKEKVLSALKAIWIYDWAPDIGPQNKAHPPQRWFARPGEAGLFTCTWPKSKHLGPESVLYRDEIWTGIEFQVAGHMAWEGMITEALAVCRGVYDRYQPSRQNPWNEVECGDHYARAMASHGVFLGFCGFESHGPKARLAFAPRLTPENFRGAFTTADAWGSYAQQMEGENLSAQIQVKWGRLRAEKIGLRLPAGKQLQSAVCLVNGKLVKAGANTNGDAVEITLPAGTVAKEGEKVEVRCGMV